MLEAFLRNRFIRLLCGYIPPHMEGVLAELALKVTPPHLPFSKGEG